MHAPETAVPAAADHKNRGAGSCFDQFGRRRAADQLLADVHRKVRSECFAKRLGQGLGSGRFEGIKVRRNVAGVHLRKVPAGHRVDPGVESRRQPCRETQRLHRGIGAVHPDNNCGFRSVHHGPPWRVETDDGGTAGSV
ncbi:UNVERIFIED_ORG: hypothetical protein ABIB19_003647 [Arthrobacter sp. UYEF10]